MTEASLYDWEHHSLSAWCREEVSASHLLHDTPLFTKGALYLKLGALSSWSLMRAVTALHKHHPGSLWTLGFDRLWWAVTWLIRLIYFKVSFRKRSSPPCWDDHYEIFATLLDPCPSSGNIKYIQLVMLLYVSRHFQNSSCTEAARFGEKSSIIIENIVLLFFFIVLDKVAMWYVIQIQI